MAYDRRKLARLIADKRRREALSVRTAADLSGLSSATFNRIENGQTTSGENLFRILLWLDVPLSAINRPALVSPAAEQNLPYEVSRNVALEAKPVRLHLRAPRGLDRRTGAALAEAFRCVAVLLESGPSHTGRKDE